MGTRSLTHVYEQKGDNRPLVTIYRQFDGYPTGHGQELLDSFGKHEIVNGFGISDNPVANGMGCLAAQLIAFLKFGGMHDSDYKNNPASPSVGNVYVYPAGSSDCGEDYIYRLYPGEGEGEGFFATYGPLMLRVEKVGYSGDDRVLYEGKLADFDPEAAEKAAYPEEEDA
tara:strand:- start:3276 stop:3785 length:510 start_codon:yes stop_codon:yes gene_type:complete